MIDRVVDDPEFVRALARANAPYPGGEAWLPGLVWPTWHSVWALDGQLLFDAAAPLFHHEGFVNAAMEMCGTDEIVPEALHVNLTTPSRGQPVSHTDMPEFRGVDQSHAPGWFLQVMGASGLFEHVRINVITAVAWFYAGERGYFRYWPTGRDQQSIRHEAMWNTAVVGDNDFMHHKVERTGPGEMMPPAKMTNDTILDCDGDGWILVEDGQVLDHYGDEQVRLSVSWKAKVRDREPRADPITLDDVFARFAEHVGDDFAASSTDELFTDAARRQLIARWPGFLPD